ncbi:uncharacterized protein B0I36DRAFT_357073 [Microdochium trichocladiopsis]|uniref:Uncharacterized protein n=1 Tax=Microdochium trichocladiopsis TaxID=1682393 RepID=A0A9P9BUW8_9PEZI|nr:uncharacterized protein B0I36DRAFT_357073 [Microdochium trichocladiopsis]KAH7039673.1 hypothetical protein B0I36DRAFT_357073 [Microdochium trichocladiopsis]
MRSIISAITTALALASSSLGQGVPDEPISFYARLYHNSSTCATVTGGRTSAYLGSMGSCVNISVNGGGSAEIIVGEVTKYFLAGWTGRDCTGQVVLVESNVRSCIDFGGVDIQSWSNDMKPFGK